MKKYTTPFVKVLNFTPEDGLLITVSGGGSTGSAWSNQKESSGGWSAADWKNPSEVSTTEE